MEGADASVTAKVMPRDLFVELLENKRVFADGEPELLFWHAMMRAVTMVRPSHDAKQTSSRRSPLADAGLGKS